MKSGFVGIVAPVFAASTLASALAQRRGPAREDGRQAGQQHWLSSLDKAPAKGTLAVTWLRGDERLSATLDLADGWKKTDLEWRASVRWRLIPSLPLSGEDLTADERRALALSDKQLAFQSARLKPRAKEAGVQDGDIVVAIDDRTPEMTVAEFRAFIRHEFLVGDTITLTVLRNGEPLKIPLTLSNP